MNYVETFDGKQAIIAKQIQAAIRKASTEQKVAIHNYYCVNDAAYDYHIESMDDFNDVLSTLDPWEIATKIHFGTFFPNCNYFMFDGYDNIECMDDFQVDKKINDLFSDDIAWYIAGEYLDAGVVTGIWWIDEILESFDI